MKKLVGASLVMLGMLGAAPLAALAEDHDHHNDHVTVHFGGDGFGFSFGGGGSHWDTRGRQSSRDRNDWRVHEERDWRGGWSVGYTQPVTTGHWEYQTETYIVTPGYWRQTFVSNGYSGHYVNTWVEPVYGTRTVSVWVRW